ncbi:membrane protein [Mycobacterium avium 10-5581]|nr:membrane protein [Mycobacterium avium 10-5581]
MGRKVAIPWHASFSIAAGVLYFFFVLPRWPELMGDTTHSLGTALRIVAGVLVALAALPVVFTLLRTRKPELGTPQLALSLRVASIVAHVLAGLLIIGTAVSEIWLSLDAAGRWLFGIYGAAAAIALLGIFAFYLAFVAELPPPPPKPIKAKKPKKRRLRRKKAGEEAETAETAEAEEAEAEEADETEAAQAVTADTEAAEAAGETEATEAAEDTAEAEKPAATEPEAETPVAEDSDESQAKLRNRRPTGKGTHRMRRRRTRAGVAVDQTAEQSGDDADED